MKILWLLFVFWAGNVWSGESHRSNCFSGHIRDSIHINIERQQFYREHSNGLSDRALNSLVSGERMALPVAWFFDLKAKKYHRAGVDLFCREFLDMLPDPTIDTDNLRTPVDEFQAFNWQKYQLELKKAVQLADDETIRAIALGAIEELKAQPSYRCMMRHTLESVYRIAHYIPIREIQALKQGVPSPRQLMLKVIDLHLKIFSRIDKIDVEARPVQALGLPIICAEVPDLLNDLL